MALVRQPRSVLPMLLDYMMEGISRAPITVHNTRKNAYKHIKQPLLEHYNGKVTSFIDSRNLCKYPVHHDTLVSFGYETYWCSGDIDKKHIIFPNQNDMIRHLMHREVTLDDRPIRNMTPQGCAFADGTFSDWLDLNYQTYTMTVDGRPQRICIENIINSTDHHVQDYEDIIFDQFYASHIFVATPDD
jgi:hypothetical protein